MTAALALALMLALAAAADARRGRGGSSGGSSDSGGGDVGAVAEDSGSSFDADDRADAAEDVADDRADAAEDVADDRGDAAEDAADDVADAQAETADDRADAAEDAADDAADAQEDAADDRADAQEDAADDAADAQEDAADDRADAAEDSADDRADAAEDAADDRADAADDVRDGRSGSGRDGRDDDDSGHGSGRAEAGRGGSDSRGVEYDREGYAVAAREVLALTDDPSDRDTLQALGFRVSSRESLPGTGLELLKIAVPETSTAEAALAQLVSRKSDSIFALNHLFAAGNVGKTPLGRRAARRPATGGAVGIIDGGVAPAALAGVRVEAVSFAPHASARQHHGTAVAALLADAGVGTIYSANIFDGRNASAAAMVRALDWMAAKKVPVVNISLAGPPNPIVHRMIKILRLRGHAVVAAVGNDGPAAPPLYPAAYPEVIGVTAVDGRGSIYRRANRGPHTMLAAEGVDVTAVDSTGTPRSVSGTSFAAPKVSARLARQLRAPDPAARERAVAGMVRAARDLGAPGRDPVYGYGLVDPGS
jgi:hypothetical protein